MPWKKLSCGKSRQIKDIFEYSQVKLFYQLCLEKRSTFVHKQRMVGCWVNVNWNGARQTACNHHDHNTYNSPHLIIHIQIYFVGHPSSPPIQIAAVAMGWYRQIKLKTQIAHWKLTNIRNNNNFATYYGLIKWTNYHTLTI